VALAVVDYGTVTGSNVATAELFGSN